MGTYCYLYVGSSHSSWKGVIPDFSSLLFEPEDYIFSTSESDGEAYHEHKFVSTCGKAARRLSASGINLQFLRKLHFTYFAFDIEDYLASLYQACKGYIYAKYLHLDSNIYQPGNVYQIENQKAERMARHFVGMYFHQLSKDDEFATVLNAYKTTGNSSDYLKNRQEEVKKQRGAPYLPEQLPSRQEMSREYLKKFLSEEPYLRNYLDREYFYSRSGSSDLDDLYDNGLSIFASDSEVPIEFDFSEFANRSTPMSSAEVYEMLDGMHRTIHLRSIFEYEAFGNLNTYKLLLPTLASVETKTFHNTKEKGDILEDLVAQVLTSQIGFTVKKKVKRSGEEIDLVIANKIDDPFWNALQSPIILVECKFQKKKVEPSDLRNFEVKIIDRRGLCKVGLVISISGFTRGCYEAITRSSRDGHRIVLIDNELLQKRVHSYSSTAQWLEDIIFEQL